jgi:hypothetical protein
MVFPHKYITDGDTPWPWFISAFATPTQPGLYLIANGSETGYVGNYSGSEWWSVDLEGNNQEINTPEFWTLIPIPNRTIK